MENPKKRVLNFFSRLGPIALPVFLTLTGLLVLFFFRAALSLTYFSRISETPGYLKLFLIGIRMDLIFLAYVSMFPFVSAFLLPASLYNKLKPLIRAYFTLVMGFIIYMEIATFPFIEEFDLRPDQKYLEYLQHVYEVLTTVFKVYKLEIAVAIVVLFFAIRFLWKSCGYILENQTVWSFGKRLLLFPVFGFLIFLGARSTLGHRPANLSTAAFTDNHFVNELALNSAYSVSYAAYRMFKFEKNPSEFYGKMAREDVLKTIEADAVLAGKKVSSEIPFLQVQSSPYRYDRPPNVVIFLQESMGAVDVGCLKGPDITPNLCKLRNEGTWFSNMYATGTRTVRGIEAVVSGFLPTPARGVVKLPNAKKGFFTAASLFKSLGYSTHFLYGGMSNFDEMKSFFLGNDFEEIFDEPTFKDPVFLGTWGVSDEDLVRKANEIYKTKKDKPFFSLILSTSNHVPYEFPDGRIELYEEPKQTHFNAIKYADYSIGLLMELAKKEEYYRNTIFMIVADHNSHVRGNELVPVDKFHIPALLIGPNVPAKTIDIQSSQLDVLPTILHYTGLEAKHPMIGRNLANLPPGTKGRSIMQYGNNHALRVEDTLVIHAPYQEAEFFTYSKDGLIPLKNETPELKDLAKTALAYTNLPWIQYSERLYKLP